MWPLNVYTRPGHVTRGIVGEPAWSEQSANHSSSWGNLTNRSAAWASHNTALCTAPPPLPLCCLPASLTKQYYCGTKYLMCCCKLKALSLINIGKLEHSTLLNVLSHVCLMDPRNHFLNHSSINWATWTSMTTSFPYSPFPTFSLSPQPSPTPASVTQIYINFRFRCE